MAKETEPDVIPRELTPDEVALRAEYEENTYNRECEAVSIIRQQQYALRSDPLFFGFQRGENTEQVWLDEVEAIKAENPYPSQP